MGGGDQGVGLMSEGLAELGLQRPHACEPVAIHEHLQEALNEHDGAATDLRSGR